jgi:4,5-dihydroxyphthalate decarboxylase
VARLRLTAAIGDYDHVRDIWSGGVSVEGVELTHLQLPVEEIFHRFTLYREWEVSEMSLGRFVALRSRGDESMVALPVFPSRVFRHSALYVPDGSALENPGDLAGRRVGVPEWAQTAVIYIRGVLSDRYGVGLGDVDWYQAGLEQPGRAEAVPITLPAGVRLTRVGERSLSRMLLTGELDAVISARAPAAFADGRVRRLLRDAPAVEEAYWRETGVFPIMHVIVIRRDVHDAHPWLAMSLFKAFDAARRSSLERLTAMSQSHHPLPWGRDYAERWRGLFGGEYWPYGLEGNRATLETFLRYAYESGVCGRPLTSDELFPASVLKPYLV